jgi:RNA polymerase sigma factor (TIGR02999 family)
LAYEDLRAIAHGRLLGGNNGALELSTTALVHEAYLRLAPREAEHDEWQSRSHFFAFASRAMRNILVDHARRTQTARRGGHVVRLSLQENTMAGPDGASDLLGVHEAINLLAEHHPRMAQVVELRFFGGFTVPEIADILDTSLRTVEREWTRARVYLVETLQEPTDNP